MSETNLMKAGAVVLAAYLEVVKDDRELAEFTAVLRNLQSSAKEIVAALAEADALEQGELVNALADNATRLREAKSLVVGAEAKLNGSMEPLRLAVKAYSVELVKAGLPPLNTARDLYVSFLSARASGLTGAQKGANACRFGDAWARTSAETFSYANREFAYEEIAIKISAKVFE